MADWADKEAAEMCEIVASSGDRSNGSGYRTLEIDGFSAEGSVSVENEIAIKKAIARHLRAAYARGKLAGAKGGEGRCGFPA